MILLGTWRLLGINVFPSLDFVPKGSIQPANVEIIVPEAEGLKSWVLSPEGDKIAYVSHIGSMSTSFLLNPTTGKKRNLDDCKVFTWVDNEILFCFNNSSVRFIDDDTNTITLPLKKADATQVNLTMLLQNAETIYRFECSDLIHNLWLRDVASQSDPQKNYLIEGIENMDATLHGYTPATVPCIKPVGGPVEKVYSPDSMYYFIVAFTADGQLALMIYNAPNDDKITEFVSNDLEDIILGGWAADSTGVYFQVDSFARIFPDRTNIGKILKLKVSE